MRTGIWIYFSLLLLVPALASAHNMGKGKVDFGGEIVVVPCGLAMESRDQTIDLGEISAASHGATQHEFLIKLVDCELVYKDRPAFTTAVFAFYGDQDEQDIEKLGLSGEAKGLSLYLLSDKLKRITLGETLNDFQIVEGDNTMRFLTELRVNQGQIRAGRFAAAVQFVVSYF